MREIPLTQSKTALIDDEDYERVAALHWYASKGYKGNWYAATGRGKDRVSLHRFVMNAPHGVLIDHKDGNGLDCRRGNLRPATLSQNRANTRRVANKHGYKGVKFCQRRQKWKAAVEWQGRQYDLGRFNTLEAAARAYDAKAVELFGEFAATNF